MFIDFCLRHYDLILSGLILLISVLINLIKKKPVYNQLDEIKVYILSVLPKLISLVEKPGNGSLKKNLVLKEVALLVSKKFGFTSFEQLESFVSDSIELILSTPNKKEVN